MADSERLNREETSVHNYYSTAASCQPLGPCTSMKSTMTHILHATTVYLHAGNFLHRGHPICIYYNIDRIHTYRQTYIHVHTHKKYISFGLKFKYLV